MAQVDETPAFLLGSASNKLYIHLLFDEGYGSSEWRQWVCQMTWNGLTPFHNLIRLIAGTHRLTTAGHLWPSQMITIKIGHHPYMQPQNVVERAGWWLNPIGGMQEPGCWVRQYIESGTKVDRTHRAVLHGIAHTIHDPSNYSVPVHDSDAYAVCHKTLTQTHQEPYWPEYRINHGRSVMNEFVKHKVIGQVNVRTHTEDNTLCCYSSQV